MLHLSGYDHVEDEERIQMEDMQRNSGTEGLQENEKRGRAFIISIGIMMAAAALPGCGKKAEEAAVTTEGRRWRRRKRRRRSSWRQNRTTEAERKPQGPEERKRSRRKDPEYLTGEMVDVAKANRRPVAVMMSNDKASLPQYGD